MKNLKSMTRKRKKPIIFYYNKRGIVEFGLFGFGIRAKNIEKQKYTGGLRGVSKIGSWVFCFGSVG